ncbi:hypothetical protein Tco_0156519 [Tanacetum coccineum]
MGFCQRSLMIARESTESGKESFKKFAKQLGCRFGQKNRYRLQSPYLAVRFAHDCPPRGSIVQAVDDVESFLAVQHRQFIDPH